MAGTTNAPAEAPIRPDADEELPTGTVRQGTVDSETEVENGTEAGRKRAIEGRRVYDLRFDTTSFKRLSKRTGARAGVEIGMGEKFGGEVSAGWISEDLDDDRLKKVSAAVIVADLKWSPMRGTIVSLTGETFVEASPTVGDSGSVLYDGLLSIERQIRSNLTALLVAGAAYRDYASSKDHELKMSAEAGLTWWLNRYVGLTGKLRHETFDSTLQSRDNKTNGVFVGLKVQH